MKRGPHHRADGSCFDILYFTKKHFGIAEGYYWWSIDGMEVGPPNGPFPTAEGAYLSAIGE